jgi:hypothetical protein
VRDDDILVRVIDLHDAHIHLAIDEGVEIAHRPDIDLRAREERLDAEKIDDETALDAANNFCLEHILGLVRFDDPLPDAHEIRTLAAEDQLTIGIFDLLEIYLNFVAGLEIFDIVELIARQYSFRLEADIDRHLVIIDLNHPAFDDLMLSDLAERSLVHLG